MRFSSLCLLTAALMLAGCESSRTPLPQPTKVPALSPELAAPCDVLTAPTELDYDAWLSWVTQSVLPAYATCAKRHVATVAAWPKP